MSDSHSGRWFFSLRTRLLATLAAIQIVFLVAALVGLDVFLGRFFEQIETSHASQLGRAIKLGLRQQMLREPAAGVESSLEDLRQVEGLQRVWIIDKNGRVAYATDRSMVGRVLDRQHDQACVACHAGTGTRQTHTSFATNETSVPIIRYVDVVANEKPCQGCHDSKQRINGIVLVEQSTETFRQTRATVRSRLTFTGAATLFALAGASLLTLTLLVLRPVRRLMTGVARLGSGDLTVRVPIRGRSELTELAAAFNSMTSDLGRHVDEIRNKTAELSIVYAVLGRLTRSIDQAELRDIVLQAFLEVLRADQAVLLSRRAGATSIEGVSRTRDQVRAGRIRCGDDGEIVLPKVFPMDVVDGWRRGELREPFVTTDHHLVVLPIETALKATLLLMVRREQPLSEPETNANLLATVAEHVGVAFNNAELYSQAITDELTQLFTVRHFYERLGECATRYARDGQLFCVLMIDLDHFKQVNDRSGHPAGDAVLSEVSRILRNSIRLPDSGYRYGGDELAVLLPGAGFAAGREVAERLQRGIEHMQITLSSGEVVRITASIGIAACPDHGTSPSELVAAADAALYNAKGAGRNRVAEPAPSP